MTDPLTVVLVDDSALFRSGLAALLRAAGIVVAAELDSAAGVADAVTTHRPDAVVLDARMPPTHTDEGIRAAVELRRTAAGVGVLVLSTYADGDWARTLFGAGAAGTGYLLKDRVDDTAALIDALRRVASGGSAVDPEIVAHLLQHPARRSPLGVLSERETQVLQLMAEGRSNAGIAAALYLSARTVEAYVASVFTKLPIPGDDRTTNRRVLAVLTYLQDRAGG
ncbi:response regulator transcription factor [Nakamurella endophytica]|uniref:DNA-binding response regulator n=1 Tax=Nakamurella endophytica TaxID=1748367 RepID=A0A917WET3_9ACTN|nr:response regulator transcription factor [Nakamurella endophytica]GGL98911.1 DNA-binding response regulator [Nakamurella endophytica]